jgi:hypothetical protein
MHTLLSNPAPRAARADLFTIKVLPVFVWSKHQARRARMTNALPKEGAIKSLNGVLEEMRRVEMTWAPQAVVLYLMQQAFICVYHPIFSQLGRFHPFLLSS